MSNPVKVWRPPHMTVTAQRAMDKPPPAPDALAACDNNSELRDDAQLKRRQSADAASEADVDVELACPEVVPVVVR